MYGQNQIRIKKEFKVIKLDDSPILQLKNKYPSYLEEIKYNYRSSESITKLISQFTKHIGYEQEEKIETDYPVIFINKTDKKEICQEFYKIRNKLKTEFEPRKIQYLHLSKEWKFWDEVKSDLEIAIIDKGNHKNSTLMSEIKRCVLGVIGMNQKQVLELINGNSQDDKMLKFRKFCIKAFKSMKEQDVENSSILIRRLFSKTFDYQFNGDWKVPHKNSDLKKSINDLMKSNPQETIKSKEKYYSTIHSSKGLEATCVLVCTQTKTQLFNWLKFKKVIDKSDETRLGFVAFSRARKLLCVSCLEQLSDNDLRKLRNLEFKIE